MFRHLPVYACAPETLIALGQTMIHREERENGMLDKPVEVADKEDENRSTLGDTDDGPLRLPAGYTYFGQFVDHDITFDRASSLTRQNDPDALTNFRTARFDLDSLYGGGPGHQPYLYEKDGVRLRLSADRHDLQRNDGERALIGDPRNDENLIISQLQVAFVKFHNAVAELIGQNSHRDDLFNAAQRTVRRHYQWIVIHDFLPRIIGDAVIKKNAVIDDILRSEDYRSRGRGGEPIARPTTRPLLLFYHSKVQPAFMPVEFSVAAYRFGHSMVRPSYLINDYTRANRQTKDRHRIPLFSETEDPDDLCGLNGFRRLPPTGVVEWKYFLDGIEETDPALPQPSYMIDTQLSDSLGRLPASGAVVQELLPELKPDIAQTAARSLATRNLLRGRALDLPSGQDVARAMGIDPLTNEELFEDVEFDGDLLKVLEVTAGDVRKDLRDRAPLWFYILREAALEAGGAHLGPVGGRIVAEVLIGLLAGDPLSYLSVNPTWKPTLPSRTPGTFTLSDLINFGL
jgi:Animal haem peroxidase